MRTIDYVPFVAALLAMGSVWFWVGGGWAEPVLAVWLLCAFAIAEYFSVIRTKS